MAKIIAVDQLTVESATTEKKASLKDAFSKWDKSDRTTLQWFKLAEKHNAKKPMEWLQNFSQICGLWPHQLKKGEKVGAGYRTVLNGCDDYGAAYEHFAFHRFAQFLSAVAKAGNNEEKRIKREAEKAEKARLAAIEAGRLAALTPEQREAEELAKVQEMEQKSKVQVVPTISATDRLQWAIDNAFLLFNQVAVDKKATKDEILTAFSEALDAISTIA